MVMYHPAPKNLHITGRKFLSENRSRLPPLVFLLTEYIFVR